MPSRRQRIEEGSILLREMTAAEIWNAMANSNCRMGEAIPDRVCITSSGDLSTDQLCEQPMDAGDTDEPAN